MKKRVWIALISIALLCLLCGAASAVPAMTDDGCWSINAGTKENTVYLTDFYAEADTTHKYLVSGSVNPDASSVYDRLVFPYTVNAGEVTYIVEGIKDFCFITSHKLDAGIKRAILAEGIVEIGEYGFSACSNLESIQLPSTIRKIANRSFANCSSLKELNIPYHEDSSEVGSLAYFGTELFNNTQYLNVSFGGTFAQWGAKTLGDTLYYRYAPGLRIETTDGYSFGWCGDRYGVSNGSTRTWTMTPDGVLSLGLAGEEGTIVSPGWDAEAVRVVSMQTPWDDLTSLAADNGLFDQMIGLTAIEISTPTDTYFTHGGILYNYGFRSEGSVAYCPLGYTGIVEIPSSVTNIDFSKFAGRPGITGFTVESSNDNYFARDGILYQWKNNSEAELIYCPASYTGVVQIPGSVCSINADVFAGCNGITGFAVDEGNPSYTAVNGILLNAAGTQIVLCPPGMKNITIPAGVDSWSGDVFRLISGSFTVTMQSPLTAIPENAFKDCSGLTSVTIPNSVTRIFPYAFMGCTGLGSVTIPDSVNSIGSGAFDGCTGLISVTIPNSVQNISDVVFYGCTGLTSITLPNALSTIDSRLFYNCTSLTGITIPSSVTKIRSYAFDGCSGLTAIAIPGNVTELGEGAFAHCNNLTNMYYNGTSAKWANVSKGRQAIPNSCTVHTLDEQDAYVNIDLVGMTENDNITLTDGYGTVTAITFSGDYGFWENNPKIIVTPGTGRRVTYYIGYTRTEGGVTSAQTAAGGTYTSTFIIPLDRNCGVPEISLVFEDDDGYAVYHLFVNENRLDTLADINATSWTLTSNEESYHNGDIVLVDQGGIGQRKTFTLTLTPNGCGCAGELIYGSNRMTVTDATLTYTFTLSGSDINLNLTWFDKSARHTVTYDGNGSDGSTPTQVVVDSAAVTVAENSFDGKSSSDWFIFNGWNTEADGSGTAYAPGARIESLQQDLTLYAQWIPAWRLVFRENGGEGSMDPILRPKTDAEVTIPPCGFTYPGKALKEWNTKSKGTGTAYQPEATITLSTNTTLYAIWGDAWIITADADPALSGTVTGTGAYLQNTPVTLTAAPAEHYLFVNWTDESGEVLSTEAEYTFNPMANSQLTAHFVRSEYAITAQYCTVTLIDDSEPVAFAEPGTRLSIGRDYENQPEGMYWTGTFSVNGKTLPEGVYDFTMPEEDVTVAAVYVPQESITIDLSTAPVAVPGETIFGCGEMELDVESLVYRMDLNDDGIFDLKLLPQEGESGDILVSPLHGMTALSPSCTKDISGEHGRYGTVIFLFELPAFEVPTGSAGSFVLPSALTTIEESAFEGNAMITVVDASHCTAINAKAFKGCTGLTKIRADQNCAIHTSAFDGCGIVYVFAPAGGAAENTCALIESCIFIPE